MKQQAISQLKTFLKEQKLDFFLLPNSDEFFSEYLPESEKAIQFLTGFSGSNATIIFSQNKSYFFTDGRYTLQASEQIDLAEFEILNIAQKSVTSWIGENVSKNQKLALDAKLTSLNFINSLLVILGSKSRGSREVELLRSSALRAKDDEGVLVFLDENPLQKIWQNRPKKIESEIFELSLELAGLDSMTKRKIILENLAADALVITKPENLCWLLNIRAADVEATPLCLAYGILFKNGEVDFFVDEKRLQGIELEKVNIVQSDCFDLRLAVIAKKSKKIQIDSASTNYWLYRELEKNNFEIILKTDPCEILKAQKNSAEISGAIKSHEVDGLALTKFLFWIEKSLKNGVEIDEISAAEKLLNFRKESPDFLYPSFPTISGFASNGAVIHYHATNETNKKIPCHPESVEGSLYLVDSGGQYFAKSFCGTTDVTRTISVGKPSTEMIENFTRVLKGHIALARAKFPRGTSGAQLDVLARNFLWLVRKDFDHGTGHGVGSFLGVHEGPCGISKRAHQPLLEGMILSNEPGFYVDGEYGIRIENLMLVEKFDEKFLCFKTLTLAPIDPALIDFKMLTYPEKKWLYEYHDYITKTMKSRLEDEEREWLEKITKSFGI
jgi:Xaa-Pro aminopeptidase